MTFILRWPAILVLFALVLLCLAGALGAGAVLTGMQAPDVGVAQVDTRVAEAQDAASGANTEAQVTWLDVGLWVAAGIFFLISSIRLIRKTQGFWTWLLGFALYGGRWAYAQGQGVVDQVKALDINVYRDPVALWNDTASTETQVAVLAIVLVVGLFVFIVDAADRAYWDRQGA